MRGNQCANSLLLSSVWQPGSSNTLIERSQQVSQLTLVSRVTLSCKVGRTYALALELPLDFSPPFPEVLVVEEIGLVEVIDQVLDLFAKHNLTCLPR